MGENYDLRPNTFVDRSDGLTKSFTTIDHSKKTKVFYEDTALPEDYSPEADKQELIRLIQLYHPFLCPKPHNEYLVIRGKGKSKLEWDIPALNRLTWDFLYSIYTISKNTYAFYTKSDPLQFPIIDESK